MNIIILIFQIGLIYIRYSDEYTKKIVGGIISDIRNFPYLVTIQRIKNNKPYHSCGGSIINSRLILSAAHCAVDYRTEKIPPLDIFLVCAGTSDSIELNNGQISKVYNISTHPEYERKTNHHDFSIFVLKTKFIFNEYVKPIKLAPPNMFDKLEPYQYFGKDDCIVAGWGYTVESIPKTTRYVRSVILPILSNKLCEEYVPRELYDTNLCTLDPDALRDSCFGDSGGPLVCRNFQIAIVSWGFGCARINSPNVWTRVDKYADWIKSIWNTYPENNNYERAVAYKDETSTNLDPLVFQLKAIPGGQENIKLSFINVLLFFYYLLFTHYF